MSSVSAVGIPNNGAFIPHVPPLSGSAGASANQSPRSIYSVAKAIISWVYNNLAALWNQISVWCLRVISPEAIPLQEGNSFVDEYKGRINYILSGETAFPNTLLVAVCMEGKYAAPFTVTVNDKLTQHSQPIAWSGEMDQAMRDHLAANVVTKIKIEFCIVAPAAKAGEYNVDIHSGICDTKRRRGGGNGLSGNGSSSDYRKSFLKHHCPMLVNLVNGQLDDLFPDDAAQQVPYDRGEGSCHQ